jgi:hypothetical protein
MAPLYHARSNGLTVETRLLEYYDAIDGMARVRLLEHYWMEREAATVYF